MRRVAMLAGMALVVSRHGRTGRRRTGRCRCAAAGQQLPESHPERLSRRADPITTATGCSGTITTTIPGHGSGDDLIAVFVAEYTDAPSDPGTPPQTGTDQVILYPAEAA